MQGIIGWAAPQLRKILLGSVENEAKLLNTPPFGKRQSESSY